MFFNLFKKRKKEGSTHMATFEEVKAAFDKLTDEDKEKFIKSLEESATEEAEEPQAKPAEEKQEAVPVPADEPAEEPTEEPQPQEDDTPAVEEPADESEDLRGAIEELKAEIEKLRAEVVAQGQEPKEVSEEKQTELDRVAGLYRD